MKELEEILGLVSKKKMSALDAAKEIRLAHISEIEGMAKLDTNRHLRTGFPEVILAEGKSLEQLERIAKRACRGRVVLFSRLSGEHGRFLKRKFGGVYNAKARTLLLGKPEKGRGTVGVITAGTSDIPVAAEAEVMAEAMGCGVISSYDAGVAGIHRLFPALKEMVGRVDALVVVAGREGTLPAIVAGMVDIPVIGVPTSVGYGYGGKGEAALKSMLQSCSFLSVVNIDNGIGAGAFAALIAKRGCRE
ncbi:MAG: nickel pincer cofactor biosynthesis protein LarB [Candidatus Micrarchaeota archaeon]